MLSNFRSDLELLDGLETNSIRALYYDLSPGYQDDYKTYGYTRLCTITQGEKCISVNSKTFKYDSRNILVLPSHAKVGMKIYRPTKAIVYEINDKVIEQVSERICNDYSLTPQFFKKYKYYLGNNNFNEILKKIRDELLYKEKNSEFLVDLYVQELVYYLIQNETIKQLLLDNSNPANKAIQYMNSNYMKQISIKEIAYNLSMSESSLCQYFKKMTGVTPNQYYTKIKLEKAKEMLKNTSVTETAFNLGYLNISYFITLFKKMYGLTPKQYKMKIQNNEISAE
ncbi:putative AraC family transcriptional regulator [Oscillibacter valericigenes Sjm18-20]|nr:putative AraC family transcriptional regulator [Oscillibacter valericigenes Sjm18-20]